METDVTYADLKFPADGKQPATQRPEISNTLKTQDKKNPTIKLYLASALVICFLLLGALIALVILYLQVSIRLRKSEQLQNKYNEALKYISCKERYSGSECQQYFIQSCQDRWVLNNSRCYLFSIEYASWENSQTSCRGQQSDLVIISDRMEQDFITTKTRVFDIHWIGLTDKEQQGQWKWVNGSTLQQGGFWKCSQPDNSGSSEHCATVGTGHCDALPFLNNWNDDTCAKAHKYICEKEAMDVRREFES
ncbi:hepatic lectin-like [Ambystoma mexicanum]|uniref:hepatic lectin-like n=1 Tax=Ambystoma mexicanum TaxID=8296 RepID=UPI0037E9449E